MSGLSQDPLWTEPSWVTRWSVGDRVRSRFTNNTGTVTAIDPLGRHVLVKWNRWRSEPDGYTARHSSENGLERLP